MNFAIEFLTSTIEKFKDVKELGEKTIAQLNDEEINWTRVRN
nr:DUF1572 family protein [Aneurinibacillus terranovensis]